MNTSHYALIIGLGKYLRFGEPPANLEGPENDAAAMEEWLLDPKGGAVPPENIKVLTSRDAKKYMPGRDEIEEEMFMWIEDKAQENQRKRLGRQVGQRLYFHISGHGFSTDKNQGCLITANALSKSTNSNIGASAWLEWWRDAGYFKEFVLSMDCCMNRMEFANPAQAPLEKVVGQQAVGAAFVAFAAKRNMKAVEQPIADAGGKVHGVFTWAMLEGLRGAAADDLGLVTGQSLALWLRNALRPWFGANELSDAAISKWPEIVAEDDALVLGHVAEPYCFSVTLRFDPACAGSSGRLWSGAPPTSQPFTVGPDSVARLRLPAGLHAVELNVGVKTFRQAFAVTRSIEVDVTETGPPIEKPAGPQILTVPPDEPTAEIRVVGARFRPMGIGYGQLSATLPFGMYRITSVVGRKLVERVIFLDGPWPPPATAAVPIPSSMPAMPEITSAAPLPGTGASHEYHQNALYPQWLRTDKPQPFIGTDPGAELLVMVRCFTPNHATSPVRRPWEGVVVLDSRGAVVADVGKDGYFDEAAADPWAVCRMKVAPGAYTLRYQTGAGMKLERSLFVPPAADGGAPWRLEAYLLHRNSSDPKPVPTDFAGSLFMRRVGTLDWDTDLLVEKVRVALADGRPILTGELAPLLFQGFTTALASMIGGHLVLLGLEKGERPPVSLDEVVVNLRRLVGTDHPDVEALSLQCIDPALRRTAPFTAPPLLERSWRLMLAASQDAPQLVPVGLWQKIRAAVVQSPYLVWSADPTVRAAHSHELQAALLETPRSRRPARVSTKAKKTATAAHPVQQPEPAGMMRPSAPATDDGAIHARGKQLGLPPSAIAALLRSKGATSPRP